MPVISIAASINPTEDSERVSKAVSNIFPDADMNIENDSLIADSKSLDYLGQRISEQKIKDSSRKFLFQSITGPGLVFHINKQAAFMGKVNFSEGDSVLGDIKVTITTEEPEEVIELIVGGEEE